MWPHWLPIRARLPLIAQITGAIALMAAFTMPGFSEVSPAPSPSPVPANPSPAAATPAPAAAPLAPVVPVVPVRPAHLNLDFRHNFRSVDVSVAVDEKRVLDTRLEGAGRKFGVFGKRDERSFTRSFDLQPGVRVVRVRVRSEADKFDHTRVERFDVGPAAVAAMRIGVDKSGLDVMVDRPPAPAPVAAAPAPAPATDAAVATVPAAAASAPGAAAVTESSAVAELYHTLRQVLMALAGFIASVASGFLFEEYLKSRNLSPFQQAQAERLANRGQRGRRRERRVRSESDIGVDAGLS